MNKTIEILPELRESYLSPSTKHKSRVPKSVCLSSKRERRSKSFFHKTHDSLTKFLMSKTEDLKEEISMKLEKGDLDLNVGESRRGNMGNIVEGKFEGVRLRGKLHERLSGRKLEESNIDNIEKEKRLKFLKERKRMLRRILVDRGKKLDPQQITSPLMTGVRDPRTQTIYGKLYSGNNVNAVYTKHYMRPIIKELDQTIKPRLKHLKLLQRKKLENNSVPQVPLSKENLEGVQEQCWCCGLLLENIDIHVTKYMLQKDYEHEFAMQAAMDILENMSVITASTTFSSISQPQPPNTQIYYCILCLSKFFEINDRNDLPSIAPSTIASTLSPQIRSPPIENVNIIKTEPKKHISQISKSVKPRKKIELTFEDSPPKKEKDPPMHIDVKHKRFSSIDANEMRNNKMHTVASHALRRVHLFNELSPEALNHYKNNQFLSTNKEDYVERNLHAVNRNKRYFKRKNTFNSFAEAMHSQADNHKKWEYEKFRAALQLK